jgi:hypothetical protein
MYELLKESPSLITTRFNAHLTFNVLNSVQGFVAEKDPETAMELISTYSRILRKILINGRPESTLKEELDVIRDYLDIERICRCKGFSYSIDVDESFQTLSVPKSLLVSIVENGIKHGIRKLNCDGWIRIKAWHEKSSNGRLSGNSVISISNLAPITSDELDPVPGSVHGKVLIQSLVEDYELKTGRDVSIEMAEHELDDHFTEFEVTVRLGKTL